MKKIAIATIINFIIVSFLGYFIYGRLFDGANFNFSLEELNNIIQVDFFLFVLTIEFIFSVGLANIYNKWIYTFSKGAEIGFFIGIIIGLCTMILFTVMCNLITFYHIIFYIVSFAIRYSVSAGLVGFYYGKKSKSSLLIK